MKEFKITFRRQFEHIRPLINLLFWGYLIVMGMIYIFGQSDWTIYLRYALIWYLVPNFIPQIILHLRYFFLNKGYTVLYDPASQEITISKKHISNTFSVQDIREITHYKTRSRTRWARLPWDIYSYMILYLNDDVQYVITSLMAKNLELPITNKIITKEVPIAYPTASSKFSNVSRV